MSHRMGLFGLKVAPGEIVPLDIFSDVRITNVAFGEEITGMGRSVLKVHRARWADELDDFEDYDGEDSDEDDEDDEDEEAEAVAKAEDALEKLINEAKENGVDEEEEEEDDDDDSEDDEDEDNDEDEDEDEDEVIEEDFVVCSLYPEKTEQAIVDLEFSAEEEIAFSVTGENTVELLGYYVQSDAYDEDPDSDELDSEDEYDSDELALYGESDSEQDEEMEDDERIVEIKDAATSTKKAAFNDKKRSKVESEDEELDVSQLSKNQRKKLNKKLKTDEDKETVEVKEKVQVVQKDPKDGKVKAQSAKQESTKKDGKEVSKKVTTPSGLIIEDKTVGTGPIAKAGNRIGMRYVGRLMNGKQFDENTKGKPFQFKLGKGEVIAGWDEGVKGMQVGGTRRLTIPAKLAYGKKGAPPDIPGNSTLVFDVKLVEIK